VAEAKKKRVIKKAETVREKAAKKTEAPVKPRRLHKATSSVKRPLGAVHRIGQKEYHPVKLPDNKVGRFMTANRKATPKFFREAWAELRQVTWPNRQETAKLTLAVFVFAIIFGALIAGVDFGLDKLFRKLLLDK
jgi:preprotein translocase SecE subunit